MDSDCRLCRVTEGCGHCWGEQCCYAAVLTMEVGGQWNGGDEVARRLDLWARETMGCRVHWSFMARSGRRALYLVANVERSMDIRNAVATGLPEGLVSLSFPCVTEPVVTWLARVSERYEIREKAVDQLVAGWRSAWKREDSKQWSAPARAAVMVSAQPVRDAEERLWDDVSYSDVEETGRGTGNCGQFFEEAFSVLECMMGELDSGEGRDDRGGDWVE